MVIGSWGALLLYQFLLFFFFLLISFGAYGFCHFSHSIASRRRKHSH